MVFNYVARIAIVYDRSKRLCLFVAFHFVFLWRFALSFCGVSLCLFVAFYFVFLWRFTLRFCGNSFILVLDVRGSRTRFRSAAAALRSACLGLARLD